MGLVTCFGLDCYFKIVVLILSVLDRAGDLGCGVRQTIIVYKIENWLLNEWNDHPYLHLCAQMLPGIVLFSRETKKSL